MRENGAVDEDGDPAWPWLGARVFDRARQVLDLPVDDADALAALLVR